MVFINIYIYGIMKAYYFCEDLFNFDFSLKKRKVIFGSETFIIIIMVILQVINEHNNNENGIDNLS